MHTTYGGSRRYSCRSTDDKSEKQARISCCEPTKRKGKRKGKRKRKREKEKEKKKRGGRGKAARAARVKICAQGALFASIVSDFDSSLGGAFPGAGHPDRSVSL